MPDGQSFDKLIASTLCFFILMQQWKRRIATQGMQNMVQTAVYLFKFTLILRSNPVASAKSQRKAQK